MAVSIPPTAVAYAALTEACALLDRSDQGKLALTGAGAKAFLNGQVTNDIEQLEPGHGCYAAFLTPKGKMLGDLRVLDAGHDGDAHPTAGELLLLCERPALQALFDLIRRFRIGHDVELHKRTVERGLLSLIGPRAREVADPGGLLGAAEHDHAATELGGAPARLIATSAGVDVLCLSEDTARVADALVSAGATAVAEPDAEVVRVESGRPRYGIDVDDTVIPQEAGLNERAVSFTKGCYVGQETVARLYYKGKPNRRLCGLRLGGPVERGTPLHLGEREAGRASSVVLSPRFGWIALALVRREAGLGDVLDAGGVEATVVELPFAP